MADEGRFVYVPVRKYGFAAIRLNKMVNRTSIEKQELTKWLSRHWYTNVHTQHLKVKMIMKGFNESVIESQSIKIEAASAKTHNINISPLPALTEARTLFMNHSACPPLLV